MLSEDEQIVFSPVCEVQVGRQACIPPFRTLTDYNLSLWFSLAPSCSLNVYIYIFLLLFFCLPFSLRGVIRAVLFLCELKTLNQFSHALLLEREQILLDTRGVVFFR